MGRKNNAFFDFHRPSETETHLQINHCSMSLALLKDRSTTRLRMHDLRFLFLLFALLLVVDSVDGSPGDADPSYRSCVEHCKVSGCVGEKCFPQCIDGAGHEQEPLHVILERRVWDCQSECRFHCMLSREDERRQLDQGPDKYHGKWPFRRIYVAQEPVSVALSILNLVMHFFGLLSFYNFVYKKLPLRPDGRTHYEYTVLWLAYGILSMSSWFWSAVFHSRDVNITEKLDYSFAVALLGYSLILAILRAFNVRDEAARVMLSAPIVAFVTTHILYLNFYQLDYGLNMKVCVAMAVAQLLIWAIWAGITRHPSRWKLWAVVIGGAAAMLLEIYDFPPYHGLVDAHALWHATTIPLTCLWWSFIKNDADFRTSTLLKKKK